MTTRISEVDNNLAVIRQKRGFSAAQVAKLTGSSRQTIYAIEAGSYVPNTALALKLARVLEVCVEDLFALPGPTPAPELRTEVVTVIPGSETPQPGQPVQLCPVDKRMFGISPSPVPWYFPASDAVVAGRPGEHGKTKVQLFHGGQDFRKRILVAGCDPGISVLARHVHAAGIDLVLAHRNSSQALALLKDGSVHVAGTHLRDETSGEANLLQVSNMFPRNAVALISFAVWDEGIVTARDNPKSIRSIEDFARSDVSIVNREAGAGARQLLDAHLQRLGIKGRKVRGYENYAPGHLPAAWQVRSGTVDCCISTRAAARLFGLAFIPLVSERYDLAIRRQHLDLPGIQVLLDTLSRSGFRRELESLGGYDTSAAGRRMV